MSLLKYFYKIAMDLPEWMPEWIKKNPQIKKAPNNMVKEFPFNDFVKKIKDDEDLKSINDGVNEIFARNIKTFIERLIIFIKLLTNNQVLNILGVGSDKANLFIKKRTKILNLFNFINDIDTIKDALENKYVTIDKNQYKIFKIIQSGIDFSNEYSSLILSGANATKNNNYIHKLFNNTRRIETIDGFSLFSNKNGNNGIFIVFSTKAEDILRMSSSSNWTNCQNIFSGVANQSLVGSVTHSGTGIIYITNKKDFKGTGEEIIYRSIVKLLKSKQDGSYACLLSTIYPIELSQVSNLFKKAIEEKGVKVLLKTDNINDYELVFTEQDYEYVYNSYEEPKLNKPEKFNLFDVSWESAREFFNADLFEEALSNKTNREVLFKKIKRKVDAFDADESKVLYDLNIFLNKNGISDLLYNEFVKLYGSWKIEQNT